MITKLLKGHKARKWKSRDWNTWLAVCKAQVRSTMLCCSTAENANTGEEGPSGVAILRMSQARLQSLLGD